MRPSMQLAREIATRRRFKPMDWDLLRDDVDHYTYGELDPFQLDILTDWVDNLCQLKETTT